MKTKNTTIALRNSVDILKKELILSMKTDQTYATGRTASSVSSSVKGLIGYVDGSSVIEVIDQGRKPGSRPPTSEIEKWVRAKGIQPLYGGTLNNLARIIANSIAEKGTIARFGYRGSGLIKLTIDKKIDDIDELITNGFDLDIQEALESVPQITKK